MINVKSNKATIISMFLTDFILLVIMLVGLLRMGIFGTGTFALGRLGRLLWKQVRWRRLLINVDYLSGRGILPSANMISIHWQQGVIWLLLATTVELPPVVRPAGIILQGFAHR
jgi:hypothetical protein